MIKFSYRERNFRLCIAEGWSLPKATIGKNLSAPLTGPISPPVFVQSNPKLLPSVKINITA